MINKRRKSKLETTTPTTRTKIKKKHYVCSTEAAGEMKNDGDKKAIRPKRVIIKSNSHLNHHNQQRSKFIHFGARRGSFKLTIMKSKFELPKSIFISFTCALLFLISTLNLLASFKVSQVAALEALSHSHDRQHQAFNSQVSNPTSPAAALTTILALARHKRAHSIATQDSAPISSSHHHSVVPPHHGFGFDDEPSDSLSREIAVGSSSSPALDQSLAAGEEAGSGELASVAAAANNNNNELEAAPTSNNNNNNNSASSTAQRSLRIVGLIGPEAVQNGTQNVTLDCMFKFDRKLDQRLTIKWFFNDEVEPIYQWIPELKKRVYSDKYERFLDKSYEVSEDVDYMLQAYRWLLRGSSSSTSTTAFAGQLQQDDSTTNLPGGGGSSPELETNRKVLASRLNKLAKLGGRHSTQLLDSLRAALDMDQLAWTRFRALRLIKPTSELSGRFTCSVSSLDGDDLRSTRLTVYEPAKNFTFTVSRVSSQLYNITCKAAQLFPRPTLSLFRYKTSGPLEQPQQQQQQQQSQVQVNGANANVAPSISLSRLTPPALRLQQQYNANNPMVTARATRFAPSSALKLEPLASTQTQLIVSSLRQQQPYLNNNHLLMDVGAGSINSAAPPVEFISSSPNHNNNNNNSITAGNNNNNNDLLPLLTPPPSTSTNSNDNNLANVESNSILLGNNQMNHHAYDHDESGSSSGQHQQPTSAQSNMVAYEIVSWALVEDSSLPSNVVTQFECILSIEGTNYEQRQSLALQRGWQVNSGALAMHSTLVGLFGALASLLCLMLALISSMLIFRLLKRHAKNRVHGREKAGSSTRIVGGTDGPNFTRTTGQRVNRQENHNREETKNFNTSECKTEPTITTGSGMIGGGGSSSSNGIVLSVGSSRALQQLHPTSGDRPALADLLPTAIQATPQADSSNITRQQREFRVESDGVYRIPTPSTDLRNHHLPPLTFGTRYPMNGPATARQPAQHQKQQQHQQYYNTRTLSQAERQHHVTAAT